MEKKILVTYFSASGETESAAEALANALHADIYKIEPESPYTSADLNWNNPQSRSSQEMKDSKSRPALMDKKLNLSSYDEVLIGFPIWWDLAPTVINTFIEQYEFSGKTLRAFATSGGSGIAHSEKNLQKQYPAINWKPGKLLNTKRAIEQFANEVQ